MKSKEQSFPSLDFEKEVQRAKWFNEELKKGGWNQRYKVPGEFDSWSNTFPEEEVPIKTLYLFKALPLSAEKFAEMMHPSNMDIRIKWDKAFHDLETVEIAPDGARIVFTRADLSWPITDRSFVLYVSSTKQIDWYGKKAFALFVKNSSHPSKPAGGDGLIRATNGGNFYIAIPDKNEPEAKCQVFGLTNNNYNGWLPNTCVEWLVGRKASKVFYTLRKSIVEGYKNHFEK